MVFNFFNKCKQLTGFKSYHQKKNWKKKPEARFEHHHHHAGIILIYDLEKNLSYINHKLAEQITSFIIKICSLRNQTHTDIETKTERLSDRVKRKNRNANEAFECQIIFNSLEFVVWLHMVWKVV